MRISLVAWFMLVFDEICDDFLVMIWFWLDPVMFLSRCLCWFDYVLLNLGLLIFKVVCWIDLYFGIDIWILAWVRPDFSLESFGLKLAECLSWYGFELGFCDVILNLFTGYLSSSRPCELLAVWIVWLWLKSVWCVVKSNGLVWFFCECDVEWGSVLGTLNRARGSGSGRRGCEDWRRCRVSDDGTELGSEVVDSVIWDVSEWLGRVGVCPESRLVLVRTYNYFCWVVLDYESCDIISICTFYNQARLI